MISIKKINYVDWYKIYLKNIENKKLKKVNLKWKCLQKEVMVCNYWDDQSYLKEKQEFGLVFALSKFEAKI